MRKEDRQKRIEALSRGMLVILALLGGFVALGGDIGAKEAGLVLACVGLNELRLRMKFERSNWRMVFFWAGLFGAAPVLYLLLYVETMPALGENPLNSVMLPPVIVALALPFQVFSAYLPAIPRAQHLLYAFVLVEIVLGAKQGSLDPLWPWLLVIIVIFALCLMITHATTVIAGSRGRRRDRASAQSSTGDLFRPGLVLVALPVALLLTIAIITIFIAAPRIDLGPEPALAQGRSGGGRAPRTLPGGLPPDSGLFPDSARPPTSVNGNDGGVSGLADGVDLGAFGRLLESRRPIGRVELSPIGEEHLPAGISEDQLLLRAFTYDSFDGTRWSNSGVPQFKNVALGADMSALSGAAQLTQDPEALVSVTYYDPQTARPFVLAFPHAVESVTSITDSSGIAIDMTLAYDTVSGLLQARPIGEDVPPAAVEARCRIPMRRITGRSRPAANPGDLARLTALPSGFKEALDAGWKEAGRFKRDSSPQRLATDLEDWFSRSGGFTYSLQQRPSGPDAIVRFICDEAQRSGHCEYFATAMVLVLRYLGVPARMCAGYAPEKAPDEKLQWEIKECNAHAWVEVWFADSGWRVYDPTAAGYHNPSSQPPNIDAANTPPPGKKPDARSTPGAVLEGKDPVKDFSDDVRDAFAAIFTGALATLVETLESGRDAIFTLLPEVLTPREGWARTLMLAVILALLAAPFVFRLRRTLEVRERVRAGLSGKNGMKLHQQSDLYRELLTVLARHGYSREATQTPEEFARHVVKGGGASFEAVLEATDVFYRLRYGSHSDDDMTRYRRLLKVLAATKT